MLDLVNMFLNESNKISPFSVVRADYLNTFEFLDKLAENLKKKMNAA